MDRTTDTRTYYTNFDSEEIDGKLYALGDPIDADVHPGIVAVLVAQGRISGTRPSSGPAIPPADLAKPVEEMNRSELEQAAVNAIMGRVGSVDDDELRHMVQSHRDDEADRQRADDDQGGDAKPLGSMKTAELEKVAADEGVTFGENVKTNADRVKAIEDARTANNS